MILFYFTSHYIGITFPSDFLTSNVSPITTSSHDVIIDDNSALIHSAKQLPIVRPHVATRRIFRPSREKQGGSSVTEECASYTAAETGGSSTGSSLRRQHLFNRSHRTSRAQNQAVRNLNISSSTLNTLPMVTELSGSRLRTESAANPVVCFFSV